MSVVIVKKIAPEEIEANNKKLQATNEKLIAAAKEGDLKTVRDCVAFNNATLTYKDTTGPEAKGYTALHWASLRGDLGMVTFLLEYVRGEAHRLEEKALLEQRETQNKKAAKKPEKSEKPEIAKKIVMDFTDARDSDGMTALHLAVQAGHFEVVKLILQYNQTVGKNNKGETVLHLALNAMTAKSLEIINYILDGMKPRDKEQKNQNTNEQVNNFIKHKDSEGRTAFHLTVQQKEFKLAQRLVEEFNADITEKTKDGWSALLYAATNDDLPMVKYIIERLKQQNDEIKKGKRKGELCDITLLIDNSCLIHYACRYGHLDMLKYLVEYMETQNKENKENTENKKSKEKGLIYSIKIIVNQKTKNENTPLLRAAQGGNLSIFQYLVEQQEADIKETGEKSKTDVHFAASADSAEIMAYIIERMRSKNISENAIKEFINQKDDEGMSALHLAVKEGKLNAVRYLVEECKVNLEAKNSLGETALHLAYGEGHVEILRYLLKKGACADVLPTNGKLPEPKKENSAATSLLKAAQDLLAMGENAKAGVSAEKLREILGILGENVNARVQKKDGNTALHLAILAENTDLIFALLDANVDINMPNALGVTPKRLAEKSQSFITAVMFEIDKLDKHITGEKTGIIALSAGRSTQERKEEEDKKRVEERETTKITTLKNHIFKTLEELEKLYGESPKATEDLGMLYLKLGELFIKHMEVWVSDQNCPEYAYAKYAYQALIKIKKIQNDPKAQKRFAEATNTLFSLLVNGHLVLTKDATILTEKTLLYKTALHSAAKEGKVEIIIYLLGQMKAQNKEDKAIIEFIDQRDEWGSSTLLLAVKAGKLEIVRYFLESQFKGSFESQLITKVGTHEKTALRVAAECGHLEIIEYILDRMKSQQKEEDVNKLISQKDIGWMTVFLWAVWAGRWNVARYFVAKCQFDIEEKDVNSNTALHLAAKNGDVEMVQNLIEYMGSRNQESVKEKGKEVYDISNFINHKNNSGETALYSAYRGGHVDVLSYLLKKGAYLDIVPNDGKMPDHEAGDLVVTTFIESAQSLLDMAANAKVKDAVSLTKLKEILGMLGENVNARLQQKNGNTALHFAIMAESPTLIEALLDANADINMPNAQGVTPKQLIEQSPSLMVKTIFELHNLSKLMMGEKVETTVIPKTTSSQEEKEKKEVKETQEQKITKIIDLKEHILKSLEELEKLSADSQKATEELGMLYLKFGELFIKSTEDGKVSDQFNPSEAYRALIKIKKLPKDPIAQERFLKASKFIFKLIKDEVLVLSEEDEAISIEKTLLYQTALHSAALEGDLEKIEYILNLLRAQLKDENVINEFINHKDEQGNSAFLLAAKAGKLKVVKYLINKFKINITEKNKAGQTALHLASHEGDLDTVDYILGKIAGQNPKEDILVINLSAHNHKEIIPSSVVNAFINQNDKNGMSAFLLAVKAGKLLVVKYFIAVYFTPKESNEIHTALLLAAREGNLEMMQYLIEYMQSQNKEHRAEIYNINLDYNINQKDHLGETVFHIAYGLGRIDMLSYLLKKGACVDPKNGKLPVPKKEKPTLDSLLNAARSLLEIARDAKSGVPVAELKERIETLGENINARTRESGNTALHLAILAGHQYLVGALLEANADINMPNNFGITPLQLVEQQSREQSPFQFVDLIPVADREVTDAALSLDLKDLASVHSTKLASILCTKIIFEMHKLKNQTSSETTKTQLLSSLEALEKLCNKPLEDKKYSDELVQYSKELEILRDETLKDSVHAKRCYKDARGSIEEARRFTKEAKSYADQAKSYDADAKKYAEASQRYAAEAKKHSEEAKAYTEQLETFRLKIGELFIKFTMEGRLSDHISAADAYRVLIKIKSSTYAGAQERYETANKWILQLLIDGRLVFAKDTEELGSDKLVPIPCRGPSELPADTESQKTRLSEILKYAALAGKAKTEAQQRTISQLIQSFVLGEGPRSASNDPILGKLKEFIGVDQNSFLTLCNALREYRFDCTDQKRIAEREQSFKARIQSHKMRIQALENENQRLKSVTGPVKTTRRVPSTSSLLYSYSSSSTSSSLNSGHSASSTVSANARLSSNPGSSTTSVRTVSGTNEPDNSNLTSASVKPNHRAPTPVMEK